MKTSANLKAIARGKLYDKLKVTAAALALETILFSIVGKIVSVVIDNTSVYGMLMYGAILLIIQLISAVFEVGELVIFLKISSGEMPSVRNLFDGFALHPDKAIMVGLIRTLRQFVCYIPAIIATVWYLNCGRTLASLITMCALYVLGAAGALYVMIELSMVFYLYLDYPGYSARELIDASRQIMRGHRGSYLYIILSFLPLELLGILSFGIAYLFIIPYIRMTFTEFYMDIISKNE